jgi:hypothetical protein
MEYTGELQDKVNNRTPNAESLRCRCPAAPSTLSGKAGGIALTHSSIALGCVCLPWHRLDYMIIGSGELQAFD